MLTYNKNDFVLVLLSKNVVFVILFYIMSNYCVKIVINLSFIFDILVKQTKQI